MSRDTNPTKNRGLTWVPLRVSSSSLTRVTRRVTLVTNQTRKERDCDYHKLNISMVISDTSHDGDEKLYFIYYFFHLNIFMFFFLPSTICCCVLNYIATWSYGKWIYNYICNRCLLPLKLGVWILFMARCTRYNIMW